MLDFIRKSCSDSAETNGAKNKKKITKRDRKSSHPFLLYGIAFSILLFFLSIAKPTLIDFLNNRLYDALLKSAHTDEPARNPVIVDIDEKSLKEYGQWPWPRYRIAILLDKLEELGALSIGLDMLFAEDDRTSVNAIKKELLRDFGIDLEFREVPQGFRDNDKRLADALSRKPVVLGYQFLFEEDSGSDSCVLHPLHVNRLGNGWREEDSALFSRARSAACNLKILSQAAAASGFFNISPDADGIMRRVPLIIEHQGRFYPSLALATVMRAIDKNEVLLKTANSGQEFLCLNKTAIPLTSKGNMLIRFRGKGKTFDYVSAADILSDRIPKGKIQGKILFVGTSASGMKESKSTPFDPIFPGVEIHATVVDNILKKDFLSRPKWAPGLESLIALALGLLSSFILAWNRAGWSSLLLGALAVGVWQVSVLTFRGGNIFISPVLPLMVLVCNFSLITFLKFWHEEQRARERTRELAMVQEATIESMSSLAEARDSDTGEHIRRTQSYVKLLAEYLKNRPRFSELSDDESIDLLCKSAPLHDIGKVGVSDRILLKPGKLTGDEWVLMRQHPQFAYDMLGPVAYLGPALDIPLCHHEKWDGSGYPHGLRGEQIPLAARLFAVVDVYDALTSDRPYREAWSQESAIEHIRAGAGKHFDPQAVEQFIEVVSPVACVGEFRGST